MDHHEQHHQYHQKEREQRIKHEEERERQSETQIRKIHAAWFVALGSVLIVLIVVTWLLISL
jgi:type VI protein secretion system component VasF